jgi:hypothetical protein
VAGPRTVAATASFTRPSNTTAYAALDVVSDSTSATTLMALAGAARAAGRGGYVTKVRLVTDQKTNTARFRVWFYTASNPTVAADNSPYLLLWADRASRIGYVDLVPMATEDATNSTAASALSTSARLAYQCASGDSALYAVLETLDAFTPASGQLFYLEAVFEQSE